MSHPGLIPILTGVNSPIMEEGCPYCVQYFYLADIKMHLTQCTLNPANIPDVSPSEIYSNPSHQNIPTAIANVYTFSPDEYDEYNGEEDQEFAIQDSFPLEDRASDNAPPLILNFCAFDECIDPKVPPSPPINRFCASLDLNAPNQATPSREHLSLSNNGEIPNIDFTQPANNNVDPRRKKMAVAIPNQSLVLASAHEPQLIQSNKELCPISIGIKRPKIEEYISNNVSNINNSYRISEKISETKSELRKVFKLSQVKPLKPDIKSEYSVESNLPNKYARRSSSEYSDYSSRSTSSSYDSSATSYSSSHRRENCRYYSRSRSYRRSYSSSSNSSSSSSSSNRRSNYEHDSKGSGNSSIIKPTIKANSKSKGKAKSKPSDRDKWPHDKYNSRSRSRSNDRWPHDKYNSMPHSRPRSSSYRRWPHDKYRSYGNSRSYSRSYDSSFSSPDRASYSTNSRRRNTVKSSKETVYHSEHYSYKSGKESSYSSSSKRKRLPSLERPTSSKYSKHDSSLISPEYNKSSVTFQNQNTSHFNRLNKDSLNSAYPTYSLFILPDFPSVSYSMCNSKPIVQQTSTSTHVKHNSLQLANQKPYVPQNIAPLTSQKPEMINIKIEKEEPKIKAVRPVPNVHTNPTHKEHGFIILGEDTSYLEFPIPIKRDNKTGFICKLCNHYSTSNVYSGHLLEHIKVICIFCQEVKSTNLLISHLYMKHSPPLSELTGCPVCKYQHKSILSSVPKFFRHILVTHYRLTCPVCSCGVGLFTFEIHVDNCVKKLVT